MRVFIDLDLAALIQGPNNRTLLPRLTFKRGDATRIEVRFVRDGEIVALPGTPTISFGMKPVGIFDTDPVVFENDFTKDDTDPTDVFYDATPSLNTAPLNDLLFKDGDPSNDISFVDLNAEFSWREGSDAPNSTRTTPARVENDVIRGDEGTPTELPTPEDWLDARAVRHDGPQSLAAANRKTARENILALGALDDIEFVSDGGGFPTSAQLQKVIIHEGDELDLFVSTTAPLGARLVVWNQGSADGILVLGAFGGIDTLDLADGDFAVFEVGIDDDEEKRWFPIAVHKRSVRIRTITGSTTLTSRDLQGRYIRSTAATDIAVTLPSASFAPAGKFVTIRQAGAGVVTLAAPSGGNLNGPNKTAGQHTSITALSLGGGNYDLEGGTE